MMYNFHCPLRTGEKYKFQSRLANKVASARTDGEALRNLTIIRKYPPYYFPHTERIPRSFPNQTESVANLLNEYTDRTLLLLRKEIYANSLANFLSESLVFEPKDEKPGHHRTYALSFSLLDMCQRLAPSRYNGPRGEGTIMNRGTLSGDAACTICARYAAHAVAEIR